jgi:hypothetical protein
MKRILLVATLALFSGISAGIHAQTMLLDRNPAIDTTISRSGPNRANYTHSYMSFGFLADGGSAGATGKPGSFASFQFGVRYKRRLSQTFALGYDVAYDFNQINLKQSAGKMVPDSFLNNKEKLMSYNALGSVYLRLNFGRRGNQLGKYLDLGGFATYTFAHVRFVKNKLPDNTTIRSRVSGLKYYEALNYGLCGRIGMNRIVVFGQYRLSDFFKSSLNLPEPSRLVLGVQFVLG